MARRVGSALSVVVVAMLLAGCGDAAAIPSATTSSSSPTSSPSVTARATSTQTPSPAGDSELLSASQAAQVCVDNLARTSPEDEIVGESRVEERSVLPKWLVLIPAKNQNGPYTVACYISENRGDPLNQAIEQSQSELWSEERIEFVKRNNEGM